MPPNFLTFCIASTFDTLPSPSNLMRWRITSESSCFLCRKELCTTSHILGACKTALSQGRFTFRHDAVLKQLITSVEDFVHTITPDKLVKKNNIISFVRAGERVRSSKSKHTGILHLIDDWKVIADLSEDYVFPIHIALTSQRPDLVLYSNKIKHAILIELTCPCEENMEAWHSEKVSKYSSLVSVIQSNGWMVDMFAIEVGARGFCSSTVPRTLKRLGFNNRLANKTSKLLAETSRKSSFSIWLARNSKEWLPEGVSSSQQLQKPREPNSATSTPVNHPLKSVPCTTPSPSTTATSQPSSKRKNVYPEKKLHHAGFVNKGNTCYINAILQALSVLPSIWCQYPSETHSVPAFVRTFLYNMSRLEQSNTPIDPSNFLKCLQRVMSVAQGRPFQINSQQDAHEVLQVVLDELIGSSVLAKDLVTTTFRSTISCDTCQYDSVSEESYTIIPTPLSSSVNNSLSDFLSPVSLSGDDKWPCPLCQSKQDGTKEMCITSSGDVIIIILQRFCIRDNEPFKNCQPIECFNVPLKVPVRVEEGIYFSKSYSLVATINHSGKLNAGHYTATIKSKCSENWLSCNDRSVLPTSTSKVDSSLPYILFYKKL